MARFGALYEHSPWVAENAWRPSFGGIEELDARAAGGDVRGAATTPSSR